MPDMNARKEILRITLKQHNYEMPNCVHPSLLEASVPFSIQLPLCSTLLPQLAGANSSPHCIIAHACLACSASYYDTAPAQMLVRPKSLCSLMRASIKVSVVVVDDTGGGMMQMQDEQLTWLFDMQCKLTRVSSRSGQQIQAIISLVSNSLVSNASKRGAMQDEELTRLAAATEHFSGSDLYELCAAAASLPANELSQAELMCAPNPYPSEPGPNVDCRVWAALVVGFRVDFTLRISFSPYHPKGLLWVLLRK